MAVMRVTLLMIAVAFAGLALAQDDPLAWIDQHKVRAVWTDTTRNLAGPPVEESVTRLKRAGINTLIVSGRNENALTYTREAKKQGLKCLIVCFFNVNAEREGLRRAVLSDGRVEAYACPIDEEFWRDYLTPMVMEAVRRSMDPDLELTGLLIDFELYSTITGQRYYNNACYCDYCLSEFCKHKGIETPDLEPQERAAWLEEKGWAEEYQPHLQTRIEALAAELRETIHAVNPNFLLGFYPTPRNWSLVGVARSFATDEVPILLWATDTYAGFSGRRGPDGVPDDWREHYADLGINARYVAGLLVRRYSAQNLAPNLYHLTEKCDGYWLFCAYALVRPAREHNLSFYLGAGAPEQYWDAIALGNAEIQKRLDQGPDYQTTLQFGPEPMALIDMRDFRHVALLYKRGERQGREELSRLLLPEVTGDTVEYPEVRLRRQNLIVVAGKGGQPVEIILRHHQVAEAGEAVAWEVTTLEGGSLAEGTIPLDEQGTVTFTPQADGIYLVTASAGDCAFSVASSNAPLSLYAGGPYGRLAIIGGAERLYFKVPEGVAEFTITGKGASGHETIRVDVSDPEGNRVATGQSTSDALEAPITVQAGDHAGEIWSLAVTKADEGVLEDNSIILGPSLPPVLSLAPEHAFDIRPE